MRAMLRFLQAHPFGIAVVLVWLLTIGMLAHKQAASPGLPVADLDPPEASGEADQEDWMGIYFHDQKIGYAHSSLDREGAGWRMREQSFLDVAAQGFPLSINMDLDARAGDDFALETFTFKLESGLVNTVISGRMAGDVLQVEMNTAGNPSSRSIRLDSRPVLPGSLTGMLRNRRLHVGETFSVPAFDPVTMRSENMIVSVEKRESLDVEGEKIPAYRLRTDHAGVAMDMWVDEQGRIWKQTHPSGWDMRRETREAALTRGWKEGVRMDLVRATSVKAVGRPISAPRDARTLSVLFPPDLVEGLDLDGGRQRFPPSSRFRSLVVTREKLDDLTPHALPIADDQMKPFLAPEMLVQADDPEIRAQALSIAGEEKNSLAVARKISAWMNENIEQRAVPSLPNAVEVLHNRVGDCNEFSVLYVALSRATGLPARSVAGLVYLDGRFYYHAWAEVYVGRWIAVDPVFDQLPADATHIRLVSGGIEEQVKIAKLLGKLEELQVTDVTYD